MNRLLALLDTRMPTRMRKVALWALFRSTALGFGRPAPPIAGLSADERLLQYAQFTKSQVEELLRIKGDLQAVQKRLYRNAHALGRLCRWVSRVDTMQEVMVLGRILYRMLDIELQGDGLGNVTIGPCFFSHFYSYPVCQVMSAMDGGLFAGLSGGKQLVFSARITEGQVFCRAHLICRKTQNETRDHSRERRRRGDGGQRAAGQIRGDRPGSGRNVPASHAQAAGHRENEKSRSAL